MNTKVLIANRGEIAIRIAKACKKAGMIPYGIYSEADNESLHIKYCEGDRQHRGIIADRKLSCNRQNYRSGQQT